MYICRLMCVWSIGWIVVLSPQPGMGQTPADIASEEFTSEELMCPDQLVLWPVCIEIQLLMDIHGTDLRGKDGRFVKAGSALLRHYYYAQFQAPQTQGNRFASAAGQVTIDAVASGPTESLQEDLEALGATNIEAAGHVVSARISIQRIPEVALLSSLHQVRLARPQTHELPARVPPQRDTPQEPGS